MRRNRVLTRYNYLLLLVALLIIIFGAPASLEVYKGTVPTPLEIIAVIIFLLGVWSLAESKFFFWMGWVLVGLAFLFNIAGIVLNIIELRYAMLVVIMIFLSLSMGIAAKDILLAGEVDFNRLTGAACIYLLVGLIFGMFYYLYNVANPGTFSGVAANGFNEEIVEFTYYSFVTLTTLGYGDINPISPVVRTFSYLEAVIGQMYLTILVAALVGIHIASRNERKISKKS
jgi:hypothetical protein